jgi:hypothetical protein
MGKATDLDDDLRKPLPQPESDQRRRAEEISDPTIVVTLGGDLAKPRPAAPLQVIQKRETGTWD